jgi:hypothetical protein
MPTGFCNDTSQFLTVTNRRNSRRAALLCRRASSPVKRRYVSSLRPGGGSGAVQFFGIDDASICPRIAPLGSAGVATFTYHLPAWKLLTSLAVMAASSIDH